MNTEKIKLPSEIPTKNLKKLLRKYGYAIHKYDHGDNELHWHYHIRLDRNDMKVVLSGWKYKNRKDTVSLFEVSYAIHMGKPMVCVKRPKMIDPPFLRLKVGKNWRRDMRKRIDKWLKKDG